MRIETDPHTNKPLLIEEHLLDHDIILGTFVARESCQHPPFQIAAHLLWTYGQPMRIGMINLKTGEVEAGAEITILQPQHIALLADPDDQITGLVEALQSALDEGAIGGDITALENWLERRADQISQMSLPDGWV